MEWLAVGFRNYTIGMAVAWAATFCGAQATMKSIPEQGPDIRSKYLMSVEPGWKIVKIDLQYDLSAVLTVWRGDEVKFVGVGTQIPNFEDVAGMRREGLQKFLDGRWLVYSHRVFGDERNAYIFGSSGRLLSSSQIGDGISHVQIDNTGAVWVGYFDEGVYGDSGFGREGLVRFSTDLASQLYRHHSMNNAPRIDDLYALNIMREGKAYMIAYSSFVPTVIEDGRARSVTKAVPVAASAIMVHDDTILAIGDYGAPAQITIIDPASNRYQLAKLAFPDGRFLSTAREGVAMLSDGKSLWQLEAKDIKKAVKLNVDASAWAIGKGPLFEKAEDKSSIIVRIAPK